MRIGIGNATLLIQIRVWITFIFSIDIESYFSTNLSSLASICKLISDYKTSDKILF